jgi:putative membrane protein
MMGWYGAGMGWAGWLGMGLFWLLVLGLIVFLVVRLLPGAGQRDSGHTGSGGQQTESAQEILDRRFARGEIDVETYQAQRAALTQTRGSK